MFQILGVESRSVFFPLCWGVTFFLFLPSHSKTKGQQHLRSPKSDDRIKDVLYILKFPKCPYLYFPRNLPIRYSKNKIYENDDDRHHSYWAPLWVPLFPAYTFKNPTVLHYPPPYNTLFGFIIYIEFLLVH